MHGLEPLRLTDSRKAILEALRMNHAHPTADEVHSQVRRSLPKVSLGTVYRNLDYLARHKLVSVLFDVEGRRRYDIAADEHCHVMCVRCGCVRDVRLDPEARLEDMVEDSAGFDLTGHRLSFLGTCPDCAGAEGGSIRSD